ncbi:MAG TPA: hypothetical protein DEP18_05285, partial [Flavobacteriales bacterium]|nr:hypothetical protein [Flavobacteriales bacterium]
MVKSFLSKQSIPAGEEIKGTAIRDSVFAFIERHYEGFGQEDYLSLDELNKIRRDFLSELIEQEKGELVIIDKEVLSAIKNNSILSENILEETEKEITRGERIADKVASFGGSWTFIIIFFSFLIIWMAINVWILSEKVFDPYPFILLNLILSCLAAIQAPIIMMSQNRQEQKDRLRAEHDYKINLKAELEIKLINEKIDHLLIHQNQKLLEIQAIQAD